MRRVHKLLSLSSGLALALLAWALTPSVAAQQAPTAVSPAAPPAPASTDTRRSSREDMSATLRALQDDPVANPARLWIADGAQRWGEVPKAASSPAAAGTVKSCEGCHGQASQSMATTAARYPAWDLASKRAVSLPQRVDACRTSQQGQTVPAAGDDTTRALHAFLVEAARGKPIAPQQDGPMQAVRAQGEHLYTLRMGQLGLSCADCHDRHAGGRLAGSLIPQAHPTGYPQYRLQWQTMGSLERRLRNCMTGVRAQPWPAGDASWVALEAFLMQRAAGMPLEGAAVRP
jgi:L-cysteine S-thiosulfotransferase